MSTAGPWKLRPFVEWKDVAKRTIYVGVDFARPGSDVTVVRWECLPCGSRVQAEVTAPSRVAKCPMCGCEITV